MSKRVQDFKVTENRKLGKETCILELLSDTALPDIKPGQFVQVRIDGSSETMLRRPFSVHDADFEKRTLKLLVQVAGKGSSVLYNLGKNASLNLVLPLGNSFTIPSGKENVILIGGGSGIAPLLYLSGFLNKTGIRPDILLGFRNSERMIDLEDFRKSGNLMVTTEDGSSGEKGYVTDHSVLKTGNFGRIYCCGPDLMMKAVAGYATKHSIECEVSLEHLMGCGFGICLCCVVDSKKGNVCTCTDGPVFNINELKW
ncbi:MAG TPA: dihydroorotate dehydrogenase electron transfer subunit [Bacteroidales bacterium]|nr:dihydroorotate dehydrogenase electron transfer subunit [Bacteroidales bacterium]